MANALDSNTVKQIGLAAGASVAGIATASDFTLAPDGTKPADALPGCLSVIVLGVPFPKEALALAPEAYTERRNAILLKMTDIAKKTAKRLTALGYAAKAVSASGGKNVNGQFSGHISLKHAAELAGIGVITRNYLLTSPQYGNLLWLSAVLTDAPLTPDKKIKNTLCTNCGQCVKACPSGALADPGAFDKDACRRFFVIQNKRLLIKCYRCRSVCPLRCGTV
ncbi:MAG: 4Fe-4S binding protein [Clostridia bacterium]|nr:4Fe-4S binding protein [Clostridia bacterium]